MEGAGRPIEQIGMLFGGLLFLLPLRSGCLLIRRPALALLLFLLEPVPAAFEPLLFLLSSGSGVLVVLEMVIAGRVPSFVSN